MISILLAVILPAIVIQDSPSTTADSSEPKELVFERGEGLVSVRIPRAEELTYRVHVDLGVLDAAVGKVTMSSKVEPYRASLLMAGGANGEEETRETGHLSVHAQGDYALYSMDATIDTRLLPQDWPRISYRYVHQGTENRRREILVGAKDGKEQSSYRKDTRKGAPKGTRIWREPRYRDVPEGTIDLLTALYLARSLVSDDLRVLRFPLIDKDRLWQLRLSKGTRKRMETSAGNFDVVQILLEPSVYPGEDVDEEKREKFEGLFGIHGSIQIWADRRTGIPVRIQGDLPLGPLTLGIDVELQSFEGTVSGFRPVGD